jgi:hypothetical protein
MTKKNWLLIGVALVLCAVYAVFFTDWFKSKHMQIFHTTRAMRVRVKDKVNLVPQLIFGLNRQFKLTEITVVPLAEYETNNRVLPVWHLVTDSNSVPVKSFNYGQPLRGMRSAVAGSRPQPLATNVMYRMMISAGATEGQHDFEVK